jgi:integrase/recombinase XerD
MNHWMRPVGGVLPVDKSGCVYVVGSVPLPHAEAQTVEEMLESWRNQQLCRNLDHETIAGRIRIVERFLRDRVAQHPARRR